MSRNSWSSSYASQSILSTNKHFAQYVRSVLTNTYTYARYDLGDRTYQIRGTNGFNIDSTIKQPADLLAIGGLYQEYFQQHEL